MELSISTLKQACSNDSLDAGIRIVTELEPVAGKFEPIKPAIYEGGNFQKDRRWVQSEDGGGPRVVDAIVVDNVPSEANRLEAALKGLRVDLGLPDLVLDFSELGLPVHLPQSLSAFDLPHRNADAYLRDSHIDGTDFLKSEAGRGIFEGTSDNPDELLRWIPQALLFGFWQSHLGKKRQQTKLARSWVSEIVGYEPAAVEGITGRGLKGDPLNLSVSEGVVASAEDETVWGWTDSAKKGKKSGDSLAEIGHGQVPVSGSPLAVSFARIQQTSTLSFAGLRRINCSTPDQSAAARALLAALGIVAHVRAFGRPFSLRSGCDLRPAQSSWHWLGSSTDESLEVPTFEDAVDLFQQAAELAADAGLPVGGDHWSTLDLEPNPNLRKAITSTWPDLDGQ